MGKTEAESKKVATAKLFRNGRSQAVRLPKEFRFSGEAVRIRRVKQGVLLQPVVETKKLDVTDFFARLDEYVEEFGVPLAKGRKQGKTPVREFSF